MVCTRDRARWLDGCLAGVCGQTAPGSTFEVIVVDNGSRDATEDVVREYARSAPVPVRLEREPHAGLSRARNKGLAEAPAPIVAFLDDDARAEAGWLAALVDVYRAVPEAVAVGGPVVLAWTSGRPRWAAPSLEPWYSALDLGPARRLLGPGESLYGANFSVRRDLAVGAGGFDPDLGRVGRRLRSGEEWDLIERVRTGGAVVYEPEVRVAHEVLPDRLSPAWLLRRTYAYGRGRVAHRDEAEGAVDRRGELAAAARSIRQAAADPGRAARRVRRSSPRVAGLMEELAWRSIPLGDAAARLGRAVRRRPS